MEAEILELKKKRTYKKAVLTRRTNELRRLVAEDNYEDVTRKYGLIREIFKEFEESHDNYHGTLVRDSDIMESDLYFSETENDYTKEMMCVKSYIKSRDISNDNVSKKSGTSESKLSILKLPSAPKPEVFAGDSESYPMWRAAFNTLVDKHEIDFDAKMYYLRQYTSGEAHEAIEALFLCPCKESYESALEILENRFGNSSVVSSAFRRRLEAWPKISDRDGKGLQKFSDYLNQVKVAKKTYKSLEILSDEFENQKLLKKLPTWLVQKWIEKVVSSEVFPSFDSFCEFISDKAKVENHSLWECHASVPRLKIRSRYSDHSSHALECGNGIDDVNRVGNARPGICPVCGGSHKVVKCSTFLGMNISDRMGIVERKKMCYGCLSPGHFNRDCCEKHVCGVCSMKHNTLLHDFSYNYPDHSALTSNTLLTARPQSRITTSVIPVMLKHPSSEKEVLVYALLDTQSNTHFITHEVANLLGVPSRKSTLRLKTMHGQRNIDTRAINNLEVKGLYEDKFISLSTCYTRDSIPCNRDSIPTSDMKKSFPHLSNIELPPFYKDAPIGLLIGYHCSQALRPSEFVCGGETEPFAWKTGLGWCVVGETNACKDTIELDSVGVSHTVYGCIALKTVCSETMVEMMDFPYETNNEESVSIEDIQFMRLMSTEMCQSENGHYEVPLPIRKGSFFPLNKVMASKRLNCLKSKFLKDPAYYAQYSAAIQELLDHGFAEVIDDDPGPIGQTWYIPHHGILQGDKLRVVFDCSAEFQGCSLNESLLQGPNQMNLMLGILLRFRLNPVAITCDIRKMFYQFLVPSADRDLLRFLWWKDGKLNSEPIVCRMNVHIFGATSSPGVATYGLRRVADDHKELHSEEASEFVKHDFYVDDGLTSLDSADRASQLYMDTKELLRHGGLILHKVMSNCPAVLMNIPSDEHAPLEDSKLYKALGVFWHIDDDTFTFSLEFDQSKSTRRGLLSNLARFFDPLGIISPLIHQGRLIFHQTCRDGYQWDDELSGQLLVKYMKWCKLLKDVSCVSIPRCLFHTMECSEFQIHHFADASTTGYSACSYIRFRDNSGKVCVSFLMGKCKVVPLKPIMTVPRLELLAAVLSIQLATKLKTSLRLCCPEYFWTDSLVVLGYIKNEASRFKIFVANRVQRIHENSKPEQWNHVPSTDNPADDGSRGIWSKRWLHGPAFLCEECFRIELVEPILSEDDSELRKLCLATERDAVSVHLQTFKNWFVTLKVWSWVLRFIEACRSRKKVGHLSLYEIESTKQVIIRLVQRSHFEAELQKLYAQQRIPRSSKLYKLDVFLDQDGIIRVGGRIRHSTLSLQLKFPVVLPSDDVVTRLIVQHFHDGTHHQGRGMTCAQIRNNGYWILHLQKMVKALIRSCVTCSRLRGQPCEQKMADLPLDRLCPSPPFLFSACDLFGPFLVKAGRHKVKRYAVIFTCLSSRSVHLEPAFSLSSDSFLNAFRRFVSIRGPVQELRSDQGTNLMGSRSALLKMGCEFIPNPPKSSHRGGAWERMIGSARRVIEGILLEHSSHIDDEGFATLLAEAASVVNSRPLCVENISDPQSLEPLTPNHLLTMKSSIIHKSVPPFDSSNMHQYASKQWKRVQFLTDLFWSRWKKEIVHVNMPRSKWCSSRKNLVENDIVLVVDAQTHRSFWKLAQVVKTQTSKDGLVRSAEVRLADGSVLTRPVQQLVYLFSPL